MKKETKFTLTLTPIEVKQALLEKYSFRFPEAKFNEVDFILGNEPYEGYSDLGLAPSKILKSVKIIGTIEEKE